MKKMLIAALLVSCSAPVLADFQCNSNLKNRMIDDNVKVTRSCGLDQVSVKGNVMVERGATLNMYNSRVEGNLESKGRFQQVTASGNTIDGNIQLKEGVAADLKNNHVDGNIELEKNTGKLVVQSNSIDGNLVCKENRSQPTGGQNRVYGDKEGQCRAL